MSMAQYLAIVNKILFTVGSFAGTKCIKIVYAFGWGSTPDPDSGATTLPQTS